MNGSKVLPILVLAVAALAVPPRLISQDQPRIQIVVDRTCAIQPESDPAVLGDHYGAFHDPAICRRESAFSTRHVEEKIGDGERSHFLVRISEQEYVMQNVTNSPAVFVVRQDVPEGWTVDSDPQPSSMDGSTAVFLVNAEPGQRVRLHVGLRNSVPLAEQGQ